MPIVLDLQVGQDHVHVIEFPDHWEVDGKDGFLYLERHNEELGHSHTYKAWALRLVESIEVITEEQADELQYNNDAPEIDMDTLQGIDNPFRGGKLKYKGKEAA